jgi:3-methylfumaryl-CoA hydratase
MAEPVSDLDQLRQWIGRSETAEDVINAAHVAGLAAAFDHDWHPTPGEPLPTLWHWAFFRPVVLQSDIGQDGHPRLGGFMPPIPLPRRMWVGGRLTFHNPLRIGEQVERKTTITDLTAKSGRNGQLIFVSLRHEISSPGGIAITEEQDLVYREAIRSTAAASVVPEPVYDDARSPADWRARTVPDPVLLFRYSALTFNSHRIHYDAAYARDEEGYRGLVVHGPLTATLLAGRLSANRRGRIASYAFRAQQPLFCNEEMAICGNAVSKGRFDLWAETPHGQVAMSATAVFADEG